MPHYTVQATLQRTFGIASIEADSLEAAQTAAEALEPGDFDQADNYELLIDDVYEEEPWQPQQ